MASVTMRKRPHCHTCGNPMAGHKRSLCTATAVKQQAPASPAPAPDPQVSPGSSHEVEPDEELPESNSGSSLKLNENGYYHWRNPNWEDIRPEPTPPTGGSSLVSTVLVGSQSGNSRSDGNGTVSFHIDSSSSQETQLRYDEEHEDSKSNSSIFSSSTSFVHRLIDSTAPLASIFDVRKEHIERVQAKAGALGLHAGVLRKPLSIQESMAKSGVVAYMQLEEEERTRRVREGKGKATAEGDSKETTASLSSKGGTTIKREGSWWLVLGTNKTAVNHLVASHQRGMPGTIASEKELAEYPRMVTFLQLVVASILGGVLVVLGLSFWI